MTVTRQVCGFPQGQGQAAALRNRGSVSPELACGARRPGRSPIRMIVLLKGARVTTGLLTSASPRSGTVAESATPLRVATRSTGGSHIFSVWVGSFGSHAGGDQNEESDLDFLVILPHVTYRRVQTVQLQACLSGPGVPIDVLVFSELQVEKWGDVPGTIHYPALRAGCPIILGRGNFSI